MKKTQNNSSSSISLLIISLSAVAIFMFAILVFLIVNNSDGESNDLNLNKSDIVMFETSMGNFEIELNSEKAPITVANFKSYVNEGFYDGLIFHRVIDNFMVQGGGFDSSMIQKQVNSAIVLESNNGLKNTVGTVAMARTNTPNSATSQFFVNVKDNSFLDYSASNPGYAVFGKVIKGMDVVNKIKSVNTTTVKGFADVPVEFVIINKAYMLE